MIYTVTFNPSLDYIVSVENFRMGRTNRTSAEQMLPGGKGINVSIVLKNLGLDSTALGFSAGFVGEEIMRRLQDWGIDTDFISLEQGNSRINVKLRATDSVPMANTFASAVETEVNGSAPAVETEINGSGPVITAKQIERLLQKLDILQTGDALFLAGSIPGSMPKDIYRVILERLADRGVLTAVDATKELLLPTLEYRPFLIKPNHHELGEIFGITLRSRDEVIPYARKLQEMGARNVLVSMAGEGAVLAAEDGSVLQQDAPRGKVVNSVGAGDSMVAGFMTGWMEKQSFDHAFLMGIAAGSASAFSRQLCTRTEVEDLYSTLCGKRGNVP